jgi:DnaJ-class molecular chaperone
MNYNKNYYGILGVTHNSSDTEIKKSYRKLSFQHHPDKNGDQVIFGEITEAYDILMDLDKRSDYDKKSKYGKNYDELEALFIVNIDFNYENENSKYEDFKKNVVLNVVQKVDDTFNGTLEYKRWVICKTCKGTGKDTTSKFVIKDENGNVKGIFDSDDGCDFCEGTGKDFRGNKCSFCFGNGKIGSKNCTTCNGEKRILGKQKLKNIELDKEKEETIIPHMGHFSKNEPGKVGNLILVKSL